MRAVIQRVRSSEVWVDGKKIGHVSRGLLVFLGIATEDTETNASYLVVKGELHGALGEVISPRIYGGVVRYSSVPGWTQTNIYEDSAGKRIQIKSFNGYSEEIDCIDCKLDSEKVKDYRLRFERDVDLLKQAGLIK